MTKVEKVCHDISQLCHNNEQAKWKQNIVVTFENMSRKKMRRSPKETLEECRNRELIGTTKERWKEERMSRYRKVCRDNPLEINSERQGKNVANFETLSRQLLDRVN